MEYCLAVSLLMNTTISGGPAKLLVGSGGKVFTSMKHFFSQNPANGLLSLVRGMRSNEDRVNVFSGGSGKSWAPVQQKRTPDGHRTQCTCFSGVRGWPSDAQHVFTAAQLPNGPLTQSLFSSWKWQVPDGTVANYSHGKPYTLLCRLTHVGPSCRKQTVQARVC